jgi:hypothetical protein
MGTCVSEELEAPDEFKDVEDAQNSRVGEVPEVRVVGPLRGGEGQVLEHEESDEAGFQQDEEGDVRIDSAPVMEEGLGVLKENSLKGDFSLVDEAHHQ